MGIEILDCLKRERDICVKNVIPSQNTAFMFSPALTSVNYKMMFSLTYLSKNFHLFIKTLAKEDTLLRTHCCRHKYFPFAHARNICCGYKFCVRDTKNVSDFVQKHFMSATNVSQFAKHGNTTFIMCSARLRAQETS